MSGLELFDVLDERGNRISTATRREVHAKGLWHRTFQCWIYTYEEGELSLLFQLRHPLKDTFPGLLDISCAGHLLAGECPEDGVRELEEELGLRVTAGQLTPCGIFAEEDYLANGLIDREFCHIYVYQSPQPLIAYRLQQEEVSGLFLIRLSDVKRMLYDRASVPAAGFMLENGQKRNIHERLASPDDFVPHKREYYELLFQTLEKLKE